MDQVSPDPILATILAAFTFLASFLGFLAAFWARILWHKFIDYRERRLHYLHKRWI